MAHQMCIFFHSPGSSRELIDTSKVSGYFMSRTSVIKNSHKQQNVTV